MHIVTGAALQTGCGKSRFKVFKLFGAEGHLGPAAEALLQALTQLNGQTLCRAFAHPGGAGQQAQIGLDDRQHQGLGLEFTQQGQRHLGANPIDGDQLAEEISLLAHTKAEEPPAVIANGLVNVQLKGGAARGQRSKLTTAELNLIADPRNRQHHTASVALLPEIQHLSLQPTDHVCASADPMLPALPSPPHRPGSSPISMEQPWHRALRIQHLLLTAVLLLSLALGACGRLPSPPRAAVLSALSLQIELTQQGIAEALALPPAGSPRVSHVRIEEQRGLTIGKGQGLQLRGRFDWQLADDPKTVDSPFELYLQRGERGQSWQLARPIGPDQSDTRQQWLIDPLPIPA